MNIAVALDLVLRLLAQAGRVGAMITLARTEGRDSLSEEEVNELAAENTQARQDLEDAIKQAQAEGR